MTFLLQSKIPQKKLAVKASKNVNTIKSYAAEGGGVVQN